MAWGSYETQLGEGKIKSQLRTNWVWKINSFEPGPITTLSDEYLYLFFLWWYFATCFLNFSKPKTLR